MCRNYTNNHRPFPTQRQENVVRNYVGSDGRDFNDITLERFGECPWHCRPKMHKDWKLC